MMDSIKTEDSSTKTTTKADPTKTNNRCAHLTIVTIWVRVVMQEVSNNNSTTSLVLKVRDHLTP